ncbi:MAG: hypothetical protein GVY12_04730, partial [Bacteroidetes bacterium]|nr:hypothetical protein [Bacteroidota bacterium]
ARAQQLPGTLSLFQLEREPAAALLESIYFEACLKIVLHESIREPGLLMTLIRQAGCANGLVEMNSFADPLQPRVILFPSDDEAGMATRLDLVATAAGQGRLLLYDRTRNQQCASERAMRAFDVEHTLTCAESMARDMSSGSFHALDQLLSREKLSDEAEQRKLEPIHVEPAAAPAEPAPSQIEAQMAALLRGEPASLLSGPEDLPDLANPGGDGASPDTSALQLPTQATADATQDDAPLPALAVSEAVAAPTPSDAQPDTPRPGAAQKRQTGSATDSPNPAAIDPITAELYDALEGVYRSTIREIERQVGETRGQTFIQHVATSLEIALPPAPDEILPMLSALLTTRPPRRWLRFKTHMGKVSVALAADLHVLHAQFHHVGSNAVLLEIQRLWARCKLS